MPATRHDAHGSSRQRGRCVVAAFVTRNGPCWRYGLTVEVVIRGDAFVIG